MCAGDTLDQLTPPLGDSFVLFARRYVKIDDCDYQFLPPSACALHKESGYDEQCENCITQVQPGIFAVKPIVRTWKYYFLDGSGKYVSIKRKQFPIMPFEAVSLYSMQGTTADPGMVAYWMFPQRCSETIQWLIVYVMLSRPRSLSQLKSVNLTAKVREIIERGPPEDLVASFHKLFGDKIEATKQLAREAAQQYGLLEANF